MDATVCVNATIQIVFFLIMGLDLLFKNSQIEDTCSGGFFLVYFFSQNVTKTNTKPILTY